MTPPFTTQPAEHYSAMKTAEHAALCKRLIEAYWRKLGVQVFVTNEDGCLRSDLANGLPRG